MYKYSRYENITFKKRKKNSFFFFNASPKINCSHFTLQIKDNYIFLKKKKKPTENKQINIY